jgi:hypothetical protein
VPADAHEHNASVPEDLKDRNVDNLEERVWSEIQDFQHLVRSHRSGMRGESVKLNFGAVWHGATESLLRSVDGDFERTKE